MNSATSRSRERKRVGIIQSNYIPWKGYFDFIDSVDEFVILDEVQYTRRDWRNRNRIKAKDGLHWLTIPVDAKGKYHQRIDEVTISDAKWVDEHLNSLRHSYARAPYFDQIWPWVLDTYEPLREIELLTEINEQLINAISIRLGIKTPIRRSTDYLTVPGKNERLIAICSAAGATEYLSGPAAKDYMDEQAWRDEGIQVQYKSYDNYPEYAQLHPPFEHAVTVLDLLFHTGESARLHLKSVPDVVA